MSNAVNLTTRMLIGKCEVLPLHFSPDASAVPLTGEPGESHTCTRTRPVLSLFQSHPPHEDTGGIYYVCQTEPGAHALRGQAKDFYRLIIRIKVIASYVEIVQEI